MTLFPNNSFPRPSNLLPNSFLLNPSILFWGIFLLHKKGEICCAAVAFPGIPIIYQRKNLKTESFYYLELPEIKGLDINARSFNLAVKHKKKTSLLSFSYLLFYCSMSVPISLSLLFYIFFPYCSRDYLDLRLFSPGRLYFQSLAFVVYSFLLWTPGPFLPLPPRLSHPYLIYPCLLILSIYLYIFTLSSSLSLDAEAPVLTTKQ